MPRLFSNKCEQTIIYRTITTYFHQKSIISHSLLVLLCNYIVLVSLLFSSKYLFPEYWLFGKKDLAKKHVKILAKVDKQFILFMKTSKYLHYNNYKI